MYFIVPVISGRYQEKSLGTVGARSSGEPGIAACSVACSGMVIAFCNHWLSVSVSASEELVLVVIEKVREEIRTYLSQFKAGEWRRVREINF